MSERFTVTTDDGVTLVGQRAGSGPGLVLVHGHGGAKEDFADHLDALAASHAVATFDHRGHGESDAPAALDAYSLERLRRDTLLVADACGLDRFRLLGHSMGGMVVRRIATDHPHRVEALVLMDTSHGPIPGFDPELMEFAAETAVAHGKQSLKELLDAAGALDTPAYRQTLEARPGYQEFQDAKWAALSHIMWAALVRAIAHQGDDLDALRSLSCPTLVIVGEQDTPFVGPSHAMAAAIPGAELVVVADAGHSPQFEAPDVWFAELAGFLAALPTEVPAR